MTPTTSHHPLYAAHIFIPSPPWHVIWPRYFELQLLGSGTSFRCCTQRLTLDIARRCKASCILIPPVPNVKTLGYTPCCVQFTTQATGPSSNVATSAFSRASPRLCIFWRSLNFAILHTTFNVVYPSRKERFKGLLFVRLIFSR